jgi:hypothetical protein
MRNCRDVAKLLAVVQALCHLAGLRPRGDAAAAAAEGALHALLVLLVNKYPKVTTREKPGLCGGAGLGRTRMSERYRGGTRRAAGPRRTAGGRTHLYA